MISIAADFSKMGMPSLAATSAGKGRQLEPGPHLTAHAQVRL